MFVLFSSHFHQVYRSTNLDSISPSVKKNNHITFKKIKNRIVQDHVFTLDSITTTQSTRPCLYFWWSDKI